MNTDLIILNMYLTKLGVPPRIKTINDRKRVQKAIYLAQAAGADLSYDYNWYLRGPYSPELANDYYQMSEAILLKKIPVDGNDAGSASAGLKLKDSYVDILQSLAEIIEKPDNFPGPQEDWLELVSSLHFLQTKKRMNLEAARKMIEKEKHQLLEYVDQAQEILKKTKLLA